LQSYVYTTDKRGNRTQAKELSLRDTAGSSVTIAHDDPNIVYRGDWDANGSFHETTTTNARLAVMFYGNSSINLTMGTGDDCGIYDVYINKTLWQSYDGYASSGGEDVISIEVKGDGPHLLEVFQRREKNSASSGYKVRFKQLTALSAYDETVIDYTYDNLSRLRTANYDGGAVEYSYGYDLAGNLVNNNGTTRTFNSANQMTNDGTNTLDYDANGNLWKTNSVVSHTWDRANRLLSHGGLDYAYDGLGNRISQDNGTDVTSYLLDLQSGLPQVLSETVGSNVTRYVHSPRGLHATQNNSSNWFWGLQDGLGSQRAEVDVNGAVVASQEFTPYGVAQNVTGSFSSPHAFTGEPLDANGLQYHRARYYDPAMGVWANQDFLETPNRYGYVDGNPLNWVDPSGLCPSEALCTNQSLSRQFKELIGCYNIDAYADSHQSSCEQIECPNKFGIRAMLEPDLCSTWCKFSMQPINGSYSSPSFILDLNDPHRVFDSDYQSETVGKFISQAYSNQPVFFFVHGYTTDNDDTKKALGETAQWFTNNLNHPLNGGNPVLIGVDWFAGHGGLNTFVGSNYVARVEIPETAKALGKILTDLDLRHSGNINLLGHSMGTDLVLQAVQESDAMIETVVLIQGSVDRKEFQDGGKYHSLMNSGKISRLIVTTDGNDTGVTLPNLNTPGGVETIGRKGVSLSGFGSGMSVANCSIQGFANFSDQNHHSHSPGRSEGVAQIILNLMSGNSFRCPEN